MVIFGDQDSLKMEELLIGEDKIGVCQSYKYLGLEIDFKLSVERMIKERATAGDWHARPKQAVTLQRVVVEGIKWMVGKSNNSTVVGAAVLHRELNVCLIVAFNAGQRARGFFKYRGLKTWIANLVNLPRTRGFFKRAMRYEDVTPEKVRLLILARVVGCLLVKRAVRLGIVDHRIGVRSRVEGLESLVSRLPLTSVANDDKGTIGFVHVVNLLAEVILVYNQALRDWEVQGDGPHPDLAEGPSRSNTIFEPMPERDREREFLVGVYPPSHARTWEPNKLGACV
eukprot:Gb_04914 [translate_table: standard]